MSDFKALKIINHIFRTRAALNTGALFSDGTEFYRNPQEPKTGDAVTLRFRTAIDNVDEVYVVCNGKRSRMARGFSDQLFDYYEITLPPIHERISYYYEIHAGNITVCYNKLYVQRDVNQDYNFELIPDFTVPAWARGAVFYQIFVERFCNGDPTNDVLTNEYHYINSNSQHIDNWEQYPATMDVGNFYGGDLQGVMDKLDYLKDLGVDVIYLNPIFVSPSSHKYDIQDYDYVDPHFGKIVKDEGQCLPEGSDCNRESQRYVNRVTSIENLEASNQLFIELVQEVHKRGMKIILDGVFNHCGSFNKWLDRERIYEGREGYEAGAFVSADSPYRSFFKFQDNNAWPYNTSYNGWWGHDTLPKLNYEESDKLYNYILEIGRKWVSPPYNVDGWRLDVAADLGYTEEYNHRFWRDFRRVVKEANPNAIILAEHYGDPSQWLKGDQWDTVMNYDAFMEPITWFLTGVEKHSDEFRGDLLGNPDAFAGSMRHHMSRFSQGSLEVAMNELSNHDHSRFLTRTNRRVGRLHTLGPQAAEENVNKGVFREAVVFQMTWPGAPTIYYGDEAGMCGWTDPDNRRTYPWGHEDQALIAFHRDMIRIHKSSEALMHGSLHFLHGENKVLAFGRFTQDEAVAVVLNNDYVEKEVRLKVRQIGVPNNRMMKRIMLTTEEGYDIDEKNYMVQNNVLTVVVPKVSASVYIYK
jgi:alpha-glucosidase